MDRDKLVAEDSAKLAARPAPGTPLAAAPNSGAIAAVRGIEDHAPDPRRRLKQRQ